jgi:hypothetical protein
MSFTIDKKSFEIQIASDIIRDGLGAELWDKDKNMMLIEIFRNDRKKTIKFFSEGVDIPFEAVEMLIKAFDESVGKSFRE